MGIESASDFQTRQSLVQRFHSGVAHRGTHEVQLLELGQPRQLLKPGIGELGQSIR
jgi:hypothetical protein